MNGHKVDVASFQVKVGAGITIKDKMKKNDGVTRAVDAARSRGVPEWLELDVDNFTGKVLSLPKREEIAMPLQEHLVVELYSK